MSSIIIPLTPDQVITYQERAAEERYWVRCLIALDIFVNVVLLKGQQDETISSHSARAALQGKAWGIWLSKFLNWFQPNHGAQAIAGDEERAENVLKIENKIEN